MKRFFIGLLGAIALIVLGFNLFLVSSEAKASPLMACTPQPQGLTSWWRFEGNGNDFIGSNNGDFRNGAITSPGLVGNALTVSGGGHLEVNDSNSLKPNRANFSLMAWFKVDQYNTNGRDTILEMKSNYIPIFSTNHSRYNLYLDENANINVEIVDNDNHGGTSTVFQSPVAADGTWRFLAVSVTRNDPNGINVYLDGALVGTFSSMALTKDINPNRNLRIGAAKDSDDYLNGQVDEVDYYNRALTAAEIQAVFNAADAGKCETGQLPIPTLTPIPTASMVPTDIPQPSLTPIPSLTPTITQTPTQTPTPTRTPPATGTPTETVVPTVFPTTTPVATWTPVPVEATPTPPPLSGFRDIGSVRVWATAFAEQSDGKVIATGNVVIGDAATNKPYFRADGTATLGESAAIGITFDGTLSIFQNGRQLGLGYFSINSATGEVTWGPTARVLYTTLGTSQLAITPTLTINVLQPSVTAQAQLFLDLPEQQSISTLIKFAITQTGVSAIGTTTLNLKLAGGTITGTFSVGSDGLRATNVQYDIPGITTITLVELVIDGRGPMKLHVGASSEFALPPLDLGNGVLVLNELYATVGLTYTDVTTGAGQLKYYLGLRGKLTLAKLPLDGSASVETFNLYLRDGVIGGKALNINLEVAKLKLHIPSASFEHAFARTEEGQALRYTLVADWATWEVPTPWKSAFKTTMQVRNVVIMTEAPYLTIGGVGAAFTTNEVFYLGGTGESNAHIRFDNISGSFIYNIDTNTWNAELAARIYFKFGQDGVLVDNVKLRVENGVYTATIDNVQLKLAGLQVNISQLSYSNDTFTAQSVQLVLPQSWGSPSVTVTGLVINKDGVKFGDITGRFTLPDVSLGDVLSLSNMSGVIVIDQQRHYSIELTASIKIDKVFSLADNPFVNVSGTLKIANGRVSGTVSGFTFKLVGFEFTVTNANFVDNLITAEQVTLQAPANLGGAFISLTGLEIGGEKGFSVQGGSFRLPDFTIGGIGVQNVQAELTRLDANTYGIAAQAKFNFTGFSVEGRFRVAYVPSTGSVQLRHIHLAFEAATARTGIPVGPDFYLTKVWGEFNIDTNTLNVAFGVKASSGTVVLGKPLIGAEGSVFVQVRPSFEFRTHANASLVGLEITSVDLRISKTAFHLKAELSAGIIQASLELAFGKDAANEFTFYGRATVDIVIKRGSLVKFLFIQIPPFDINLGRLQLDAGKFHHNDQTVWGARLLARVLGIKFYVFAKFSPGIGLKIGTRWDAYTPVLPAVRPDYDFLGNDDLLYEVNVTNPANELTFIEGITQTYRTDPGELMIMGPDGVSFTTSLAYQEADNSQRVYTVLLDNPDDAIGTWSLVTKPDNIVLVYGVIPNPTVSTFTACQSSICLDTLAPDETATPIELQQGSTFDIAWETDHVTSGVGVQLYAENAAGMRSFVADSYTSNGMSANGNATWPSEPLPNGVYTLTLQVEDSLQGMTTLRKVPFVIVDDVAPAAPTALQVVERADGSVGVSWDATTAEADVAGYQISVNSQEPLIAELPESGELNSYDLYGLVLGQSYTVSVAAYDINDNLGPASTASVTLGTSYVNATWPTRGMAATLVHDVRITFNQPVIPFAFTVAKADGTEVSGSFEHIDLATSPTLYNTIGMRFIPSNQRFAPGSYVARARVLFPLTGQTQTIEWPFEVVEPAIRTYLPVVHSR